MTAMHVTGSDLATEPDFAEFRRKTILHAGKTEILVSTFGKARYPRGIKGVFGEKYHKIGANRYYETMAFFNSDSRREVPFDSPWSIDHIGDDTDMMAIGMHEAVVAEIIARIETGTLTRR